MINLRWLGPFLFALAWTATASGQPPKSTGGEIWSDRAADSAVRDALRCQDYPWYDASTDQVKSLLPSRNPWMEWLIDRLGRFGEWLARLFRRESRLESPGGSWFGELAARLMFFVAAVVLATVLFQLWRARGTGPSSARSSTPVSGSAARIGGVFPGMAAESGDPWDEAVRCRQAGDDSTAVIWLLAFELQALDRLGLIRLGHGRTARQYLAQLKDPELVPGLSLTTGLFEQVYYGHRAPARRAIDEAWTHAVAFRERLQGRAVAP